MSAGRGFLRGVSSGWFMMMVTVGVQMVQVRLARGRLADAEFALSNVLSNLVTAFLVAEIGVRAAFSRLMLDAQVQGDAEYRRLWSTSRCVFVGQGAFIAMLGAACVPFVPGWFQTPPELIGTVRAVFGCLCGFTAMQYALGCHQVALFTAQRFVLAN